MKKLIIAEKPSVAAEIAIALGGVPTRGTYYENDNFVIASARGHLLKIVAPESMSSDFPCLPTHFDLIPEEDVYLPLLSRLLQRHDVDETINACDAGREGELIFRRIYEYVEPNKKISRMWFQSMTQEAIVDSYANRRSDEQMRGLADAAKGRAYADWIVGINASRLTQQITGVKTPVGRVLTPTVMLIVERERTILNFKSQAFYELLTTVELESGTFVAKWQMPSKDENVPIGRIMGYEVAQALLAQAKTQTPSDMAETQKEVKKLAPLLFDLTTLQREANKLYGLTAAQTLVIAQKLYESKCLTYPRTDAVCLPEDYVPKVQAIFTALAAHKRDYSVFANQVIEDFGIVAKKRIFNNEKISDHFAIIPTGVLPVGISNDEASVFELVVKRTLAAFYPDVTLDTVERTFKLGDEIFYAKGQVMREQGWLAVYDDKEAETKESKNLPPLLEGEQGVLLDAQLHTGHTTPPERYTENTLLSAMERAGKNLTDEQLREAMGEKGLGTPATRADVIERAVEYGYIERLKKAIHPTNKANELSNLLTAIDAKILTKPELTAQWETDLASVEQKSLTLKTFLESIASTTANLVSTAQNTTAWTERHARQSIGQCPKCKSPILEFQAGYSCMNKADCGYFLYGTIAKRKISVEEAVLLLAGKTTDVVSGFKSNEGKPFAAAMRLSDEHRVVFEFPKPTTHPCPNCGKNLYRKTAGGRDGYDFWGCEGYRDKSCNSTFENHRGKPQLKKG